MSGRLDMLARHHDRLLEIVSTARPLITEAVEDADLEGLRHLRGELVAALAAYQRFVHEEIYVTAQHAGGPPEALGDALTLKIDCIQLQSDYEDFGLRWTRCDVLENWPEYRLSAHRMIRQLEEHVAQAGGLRNGWGARAA